jgi:hypothetical protein
MTILETRKKTLVEAFGKNGCIDDTSWMAATLQDINGVFRIYPDDMVFMYNGDYCIEDEETPTKVIVREYNGVSANITVDDKIIGKTNTFIEIEPGDYTGTVSKDGYISQEIAFVVTKGKTNEYKYVTLIKETVTDDEDEYETPTGFGAILTPTMRILPSQPPTIETGKYLWFGWEFRNTGDEDWKGKVGVKLVDSDGNIFQYTGDETKKQTVKAGEIKTLWVYCLVENTITPDENTKVYALLTKTS